MKLKIIFFSFLLTLISCEVKTDDAEEAYQYWSGEKPTQDLNIEYAKYWRSPHWSYEYKFYLTFRPSEIWWNEFLKRNNLKRDMKNSSEFIDVPAWFHPTKRCIQYRSDDDFDQGSRYYRDSLTGKCFIYEVQL
jgi:hypothetical protein